MKTTDNEKENDFRKWLSNDLKVIDVHHVSWTIFDVKCAWDFQKREAHKLRQQLAEKDKEIKKLESKLKEAREISTNLFECVSATLYKDSIYAVPGEDLLQLKQWLKDNPEKK